MTGCRFMAGCLSILVIVFFIFIIVGLITGRSTLVW